jgi:hypothetical protein
MGSVAMMLSRSRRVRVSAELAASPPPGPQADNPSTPTIMIKRLFMHPPWISDCWRKRFAGASET